MLKRTSLVLLLLLQTAALVSSVSFTLNLERPNSTAIWKLVSDDYRDLEKGKPGATLKSGTDFPYDPEKRKMQIFAFKKLLITAPLSGNYACNVDFNAWLRNVNLDLGTAEVLGSIPQCVGATLSTVGIQGSWTIPKVTNTSGKTQVKANPNPINLKYLIGGNGTIQIINSKTNVMHKGSSFVKPTHLFSQWTNQKIDSSEGKVSVKVDVKSDSIMLLLDIIKFQTLIPFQRNAPPLNNQFDWKPNDFSVIEIRNVSVSQVGIQPPTYVLTVKKGVFPMKLDKLVKSQAKSQPTPTPPGSSSTSLNSVIGNPIPPKVQTEPTTLTTTRQPPSAPAVQKKAVNVTPAPAATLPPRQIPAPPQQFIKPTPVYSLLPPRVPLIPSTQNKTANTTTNTTTTLPPLPVNQNQPIIINVIIPNPPSSGVPNTTTTPPPKVTSPPRTSGNSNLTKIETKNRTTAEGGQYVKGHQTGISPRDTQESHVHIHIIKVVNQGGQVEPAKVFILSAVVFSVVYVHAII